MLNSLIASFRRRIVPAVVRQYDVADCGPAALLTVLRYHGGNASLTEIRELTNTSGHGTTMLSLVEAAKELGFDAFGAQGSYDDLCREKLPAIAHITTDDGLLHYVVVLEMTANRIRIADPARGVYPLQRDQFVELWKSRAVVLLEPTPALRRTMPPRRRDWLRMALRGQESYLIQSVFLGTVYAMLGLLTAVFVQVLIDRLIPERALFKIMLTAGALLAVQVLRALAGFIRQRFLVVLNQRVSKRMADDFLRHLLRLPLRFFESRKTGDVTSRLNDTARIQNAIVRVVGGAAIDLLVVVGAVAFIFLLAPSLGWVALGSVPLYALLVVALARRVSAEQSRVMGGFAQLDAAYIDSIHGVEAILGFRASAAFSTRLVRLNDDYQRRLQRFGNTQAVSSLGTELASGLVMVIALAIGALLVIRGHLLLGAMMGGYSLLATMLPAIGRLVETSITLQGAAVATSRLLDLLLVPPEGGGTDAAPATCEELRLENLSFRWPRGKALLDSVTLSIRRGQITGLRGASGSGKSTLVKILERKHLPSSGRLLVDGVDAAGIDLDGYRSLVGVVPETVPIFNATLVENITLGRPLANIEQIRVMTEAIGLGEFLCRFELGLGTPVGEDGRQLSSGERQILGVLRALLDEPAVLIVDEGINAIDAQSRELVLAAIRTYARDHAVLLVSHDSAILRLADVTYALRGAKIIQADAQPGSVSPHPVSDRS